MKTKIIFIYCILLIANCQLSLQAQTWHAIGNGIGEYGYVSCLKVIKDTLYVGGAITRDWGAIGNGVISFDGENWDSLACGPDGYADNIDTFTDGKIYITGGFYSICGDYTYSYIAKWNGTSWEHFTGVLPDSPVDIQSMKFKDQLYFGGGFYKVGGMIVNRVASWDGSNWHAMSGGVSDPLTSSVLTMAVYDGDLIIGGAFMKAGNDTVNNIAAWDGSQWHALGNGVNDIVFTLYTDTVDNLLYAGGNFTMADDTIPVKYIACWNGQKWNAMNDSADGFHGLPGVYTITRFDNKIYAGGTGFTADTVLVRWDGIHWENVAGVYGYVKALSVYKGNLYVGGDFPSVNGDASINDIACYGDSCPLNVGINEIQKDKTEYLWQNIPNPFDNSTTIPYYVPYGCKGSLQIIDTKGELVDEYALQQGKNKLEVSLAQFKTGVYYYSLLLDGKIVQTKKMVLQ